MEARRLLSLVLALGGMGSMYGNSLKFFSERAESAPLEELVEQSSATTPDWNAEGEYVAEVRTPLGTIPTQFTVLEWAGAEAPVLVFHHGSGDIPYTTRGRRRFLARERRASCGRCRVRGRASSPGSAWAAG